MTNPMPRMYISNHGAPAKNGLVTVTYVYGIYRTPAQRVVRHITQEQLNRDLASGTYEVGYTCG